MLGEITLTHAAEEELHELQSLLAGIQLDVDVMDNRVLRGKGKFLHLRIVTSSPSRIFLMIHSLMPYGAASLPKSVIFFFGYCTERG